MMNFPKLLHIQVTEEDIKRAKKEFEFTGSRADTCPIAQSLKRLGYFPYVTGNIKLFLEPDGADRSDHVPFYRYRLPLVARDFIEYADANEDNVVPFKFIALRYDDVPVE